MSLKRAAGRGRLSRRLGLIPRAPRELAVCERTDLNRRFTGRNAWLGGLDSNQDSQIQRLAHTEPISVDAIPMFIARNAVYGDFVAQAPVDCCIGGFHTAFETNQTNNKIFVQTFTFAAWLDPTSQMPYSVTPRSLPIFCLSPTNSAKL